MYLVIKRKKLTPFVEAMKHVKIYTEIENFDDDCEKYTVRIDVESFREAFYIGRWVGRNCSTDEIIIKTGSPNGMGLD